jgi:HEPN domain-containing protein
MRPDPRSEADRWLEQAGRDLDDAKFAREGNRHNLACFLCQQASEKALKAFLILHGVESPWGHSVADLSREATRFDESLCELHAHAATLDVFYIPTRYPNGLPGGLPADAFGESESERAVERAARVIEEISRRFPR